MADRCRALLIASASVLLLGCQSVKSDRAPLMVVKTLGPANLAQSYAALQIIVEFEGISTRRLACDVQMDSPRTGDAHCFWLEP